MPEKPFQRLDLEHLDPEYALLTSPKFRLCLEGKDPYNIKDTTIVAVGSPVGLALVSVHKLLNYAIMHSFTLKKGHWSIENAAVLLKETENEVLKEEGYILKYLYLDDEPWTPIIDAVLEKRKWADPELQIVKYFFDSPVFHPPWIDHPPKLPPLFKEFPWKVLSKGHKEALKRKQERRGFPASVSPFGEDERIIEPINSLGLKYKNEIVGWMITHRIAHDMIRYSHLYIDPEYQFRGYSARLLIDSINKQRASTVKWALFEVNLDQVEPSWMRFVERRLEPYAHHKMEVYKSWKDLRAEG